MSDFYNQVSTTTDSTQAKLHICLFSCQTELTQSIIKRVNEDLYKVENLNANQNLLNFLSSNEKHIECIIIVRGSKTDSILKQLCQAQILLPTVIVEAESTVESNGSQEPNRDHSLASQAIYHSAEIRLYPIQIAEINTYINLAINKFLSLAPGAEAASASAIELESTALTLVSQQRRLTEKIKERLGYSGVYYKRQATQFYRNLSSQQQQQLDRQLSQSYRHILIEYFNDSSKINQLIDEFVDRAFFADVSTSQILEMHMELIDDFAYQLKLEGRNDDILLDYRLPLIDILAHLCEMYRRSIPGNDMSLDLLFTVK